ncbi:MAG: OB-fold domain-containing protein [Actinomycetota bacterium]|nr:OB-fold domain-containing protein [Actinomycetota bacterium]
MRGIVGAAAYIPYRRLDRAEISSFLGSGGGRGTRAVAGHDEDTTTMGAEAARLALRAVDGAALTAVWFTTTDPAYLDKSNATAIHRALRLPHSAPAYDFGGALRSGVGALQASLGARGTVLVVSADRRDGLPMSSDEVAGGDAAAALLVGDGRDDVPLLAEHVGGASSTDEFVDRWRIPGERQDRLWEDRFGETRYLELGMDAWTRACENAGIAAADVSRVIVSGMHGRAVTALTKKLGLSEGVLANDWAADVGQSGCAHPGMLLASVLEEEAAAIRPGEGVPQRRVIVLLHLADGADALVFRTTPALATWSPTRSVAHQVATGAPISYGKFLTWRGMLKLEPPRRPEPSRVSSTAAWRNDDWKFGFVGTKDRSSGAVHLPPARVSMRGGAFDDMEHFPLADSIGTIVTFTVDRMAYSPSPPIVFAVVDFDRGGRFPVELTDVDADTIAIGDQVEMTFRRLFTADGIADYFWKARPLRNNPTAMEHGR